MKKIILTIEDNVYDRLRSALTIRKMAGAFYGDCDAALGRIITAIENGDQELHLRFKGDKKDDTS